MVDFMENPTQEMDDWWVPPMTQETPILTHPISGDRLVEFANPEPTFLVQRSERA